LDRAIRAEAAQRQKASELTAVLNTKYPLLELSNWL